MKKKIVSIMLTAAMTATLLAGCGNSAADTAAPAAGTEEAPAADAADTAAADDSAAADRDYMPRKNNLSFAAVSTPCFGN